jgi:hypothetical protein
LRNTPWRPSRQPWPEGAYQRARRLEPDEEPFENEDIEALRERLVAAERYHAKRLPAWSLACSTCVPALAVAFWLLPLTSPWWILAPVVVGAIIGLFGYHRSCALLYRRLQNRGWVEEREASGRSPIYGLIGLRFYIR